MKKNDDLLCLAQQSWKKTIRIMKLTVGLLLMTMITATAVNTYSQNARISLNVKDATILDIFREIERNSEFGFFYKSEEMNLEKRQSIEVSAATIDDILKKVLDETYTYKILDKNIVVTKGSLEGSQQQIRKVSGKVTDSSGATLPGVSVVIKGTTTGTVTDAEGNYSLSNILANNILQFSFVGMKGQEVAVGGKTSINISLVDDAIAIDEVVAVGYGTMKKSDVNASIVSVSSDELVKSSSPNVSEMLMGRASGLTIRQSNAQPGGGISVTIRGAASTGAGNDPLYVIDGFPVANSGVEPGSGNQWSAGNRSPLNDINPNDIESIEILKDASATAIYGARGSNGVILITTKRGKKGTKVEYSFNTSVQTISKKPELLNAQEFMAEGNNFLYEKYLINRKLAPYGNAIPGSVSPFIPKYTEQEIAAAGLGTNWYDMVLQSGKISQHNLSISQGNDNIKSLISFNYFNQEGIVKSSGLERFSLRMNIDQKIFKWWNYGISSNASMVKEKNSSLGDGRDATAGILESALNYSPLIEAKKDPLSGKWNEDPLQALLNHPLSYLDVTDNTMTKRFLTSIFTNVYIKPELWVKLSAGVDIRDGIRQNYYPKTTRYGSQVGGDANVNEVYRQDYLADVVINYQKQFNEKHKLVALAGYSYQIQNNEGNYSRAMGFSTDALYYYSLQAGEKTPILSSWRNRHVLASYFSRIQYSFENKYLFTFTGRRDGSDRFGENNRYAFFPSGAFAWRVIEEDFLQTSPLISDLKLRLSAGQVGNENIANDAASEYYAFQNRNYYFNSVQKRGVNLAKMANPDLKWETTTEFNLGLDFGLFKNRFTGNVDVFYKEIKDLLSNRRLPHNSVVSTVPWNVGKTQSKGLEISLNSVNIKEPLYWTSTLTFTSYRDRWKERDPKVILLPYQSSTDPLTAVFTLTPDGIKQPGENTPVMPNLLPGQQKYKDINGLDQNGKLTGQPDGKINQADVVFRGTTAPKFILGLNNNWKYKGFDVDCFIYASVGNLKWPSTRMEHSVYGSYGVSRLSDNYNFLKEIENRWTSKNPNSDMPSGEVNSYDQYGAPFWEKGSYVRLKSLSLGYDFSKLIAKQLTYSARIFVNAQNLFTVTKYNGMDPEVENERAAYPQQKTFSLGIDIKF